MHEPDGPLLVDQLRFMAKRASRRSGVPRSRRRTTQLTFREWDEHRTGSRAGWSTTASSKHDRVALYMDSDHCLHWIAAYAGIHKAGAVMVPVNTRLSTTRCSRSSATPSRA